MFAIPASKMKRILKIIETMNDTATLRFGKEGMECRVVDNAHIAMANVIVDKLAFITFDEEAKEPITIDVAKLSEFVKLSKGDEGISFGINDQGKLKISFGGLDRIMAIAMEGTDPKLPNLNLPIKAVISKDRLSFGNKAAALVSDHLIIEAKEEGIIISARGDIDTMKLTIPKEEMTSYEYGEEKKSMYNLDYLKGMVESLDDEVEVSIDTDFPVVLKSNAGNIRTMFLLAPRIEND